MDCIAIFLKKNSIQQNRSFSSLPLFGQFGSNNIDSSGSMIGGGHALGMGVPGHGGNSNSNSTNQRRSTAEARAARLKALDTNTTTTTKSSRDNSSNHTQLL
jgi:hypothetical protein